MAEDLEPWRGAMLERRHPIERAPAFGVAREAECQLQAEHAPAAGIEAPPTLRRERGPFVTYLTLPWSYSESTTSDRWHRWKCRLGRHAMAGGYTMQIDGSPVFVARCCRWCDAEDGG